MCITVVSAKSILIDLGTKLSLSPTGIYQFKVNNRNTRTRCEIYSKLTIKIVKIIKIKILNS